MEESDLIAAIAAAISGLAAIGAIISGVKARQGAKAASDAALAAQTEANRITADSRSLQAMDWTSQYFEGVRRWADDVAYAMTEAMHLSSIENDEERAREWNRVRARLSTSIDTGRWYFPNKFETDYGTHKPPAYRGIRRRVLDHVVNAYNALPRPPEHFKPDANNDSYTMGAYGRLKANKRAFVSEIQELLNPRHREQQVRRIVDRFEIIEKMRVPSDKEPEETSV